MQCYAEYVTYTYTHTHTHEEKTTPRFHSVSAWLVKVRCSHADRNSVRLGSVLKSVLLKKKRALLLLRVLCSGSVFNFSFRFYIESKVLAFKLPIDALSLWKNIKWIC